MTVTNNNLGFNFIKTGFRDYLASRCLLNNEIIMPGVTLASSAVEKYLKAILFIFNIKKKVHLDNITEIRNAFNQINLDLFEKLDKSFLAILSDAYKLRYYDNFNNEISFGFLVNQLLAELDFTIDLIDSKLSAKNERTGMAILTPYRLAVDQNNDHLYKNNYILQKIDKKEFMERASITYALHIGKNGLEHEISISKHLRIREYDGEMARILNIEFKNKNYNHPRG